jgi:CTP:molybdopterin cytidylyltransferase MocA
MLIYALIPANGKGSRFGMPKVDAVYNGLTFAQMIENTLIAAGDFPGLIIRDVDTPDMLSSLRYGMQQTKSAGINPDGWLIWPVDHPFVQPGTLLSMREAFQLYPDSVIIPRFNNKNGHPIIIPASLEISHPEHAHGLKEIIRFSGKNIQHVDVPDGGINKNVNTPEDVNYV